MKHCPAGDSFHTMLGDVLHMMSTFPGDCAGLLNTTVANCVCNTVDQCSYGLTPSYWGCRGNGKHTWSLQALLQ